MISTRVVSVLLTSLTARGFSPSSIHNVRTFALGSLSAENAAQEQVDVPLLLGEGVFAVHKPLEWTSSDVVTYIRGILERDARRRGAKPAKVGSRRKNRRVIKVGHGGTLDPLATGVLVIGVGKGTKELET